ncbi:MAG TPA: TonB-dependent receptor, partial [Rhodothermales bacterium]|nr:TonB-dependent receptor [Rhodothermales bacterium]
MPKEVIRIALTPQVFHNEVEITGSSSENLSILNIPVSQIKEMPLLLGESDILKAYQLMPGVKTGLEGTSGMYVRGGSPDQNLILLDGAPVYNASHLFGFFSIFNTDAIQHTELIKGGFPARYGGRLSSVLEVNMKEGNAQKFKANVGIGILDAKTLVEGPLIKDKASFMVSARKTYADVLLNAFNQLFRKEVTAARQGYGFYDANAKFNYLINPQNRIFLSYYGGDDLLYSHGNGEVVGEKGYTEKGKEDLSLGWGNQTGTLRWVYVPSASWFGSFLAYYTQFRFRTYMFKLSDYYSPQNELIKHRLGEQELQASVKDWGLKSDWQHNIGARHHLRFGVAGVLHHFDPQKSESRTESLTQRNQSVFNAEPVYGTVFNIYMEDEWQIIPTLKANLGGHASIFRVRNKNYSSFQPRFSATWQPQKQWTINATYAVMQQYIHLLTNSGVGLPNDIWVPATDKIAPQEAWQTSIGAGYKWKNGQYSIQIEGFYKSMQNLIAYREGASLFDTKTNWEALLLQGKGQSYGVEWMLQKHQGRLTGWIGYTWSRTLRQFDELNDGLAFPYRYDRIHDASVVANYKLNKKLKIAATFVYGTGIAITLPVGWYHVSLNPVEYIEGWNQFRLPATHRLDIGGILERKHKNRNAQLYLGLYNAYNRKNPFAVVREQGTFESFFRIKYLFPILPFI